MPNDTITVYVSYARKDEPLLIELSNHLSVLKKRGIITSWDGRNIEAGEDSDELTTQKFFSAQVILLLTSSDFLASEMLWHVGVTQAIERHHAGVSKVIPIILRPCDWESAPFSKLAALPKDSRPVTTWDNRDEAFLDVAQGIRSVVETLRQELASQPLQAKTVIEKDVSPYQGLKAFVPETAEFFFGQQKTIDLMFDKLNEANFVPLIGPSGSGKSSVVFAGLIPQLRDSWLILDPIRPDLEPMAELRKAVRSLFKRKADLNKVTQLLRTHGLLPAVEMISKSSTLNLDKQRILLIIDQFEEVFTVCSSEEERRRFIRCITEIQTLENSPLSVVTTMRADFVEQWLDYGELVHTIQEHAVWLGPMQGIDLIQAITQPAKNQGYEFSSGLLDLILEDVREERNCLPLLEFSLTELWEKRDTQRKELPLQAYQDMERLKGSLNKRAEEVYCQDLLSDKERAWAKRIFTRLLSIGADLKDTRKRQHRQALLAMGMEDSERDLIDDVIEVLVEGRLLVIYENGEVDLAHEALITGWRRFDEWRQKNRDKHRLMQRVHDAEDEWNLKGQDDGYLLQGGLLAEIQEQWFFLEDELTYKTKSFYQLSRRRAEQTIRQISLFEENRETLESIELARREGIDIEAILASIKELQRERPDELISLTSIEPKEGQISIQIEVSSDVSGIASGDIEADMKQLYTQKLAAIEAQYSERLKLSDTNLDAARRVIEERRKEQSSLLEIIKTMAEIHTTKYEFNVPVGNPADYFTQSDTRIQSLLSQHPPEQRQNLSEAAKEINKLLEQISENHSALEISEQAIDQIDKNKCIRNRVFEVLKTGGQATLEELVEHPAIGTILAAIKAEIE